jgi:hypothetical protein
MTTYFADGDQALIRVHCDGWHDLAAFYDADAERFTARGGWSSRPYSLASTAIHSGDCARYRKPKPSESWPRWSGA